MTKEWAEGAILPGAAGQGGAKQPRQDIFSLTNTILSTVKFSE